MIPQKSDPSLSSPEDIAKACRPPFYGGLKKHKTPLGMALELSKDHECNNSLYAIGKILTQHHDAIRSHTSSLSATQGDIGALNAQFTGLEQNLSERIESLVAGMENRFDQRVMEMQQLFERKATAIEASFDQQLMTIEREAGEWQMMTGRLQTVLERFRQDQALDRELRKNESLQKTAALEKRITGMTDENALLKEQVAKVMGELVELKAQMEKKMLELEVRSSRSFDHHTQRVTTIEGFMFELYCRQNANEDSQDT